MKGRLFSIVLSLCFIYMAIPNGYCQTYENGREVVYVKSNAKLKRLLKKPDKHYIIRSSHDLGGRIIKIGENSVLDFNGGLFQNGTVEGNDTRLMYSKPFYGECLEMKGCFISNKEQIRDIEVFICVRHTQDEIQSLFDLSGGVPLSFSNGSYRDVKQILIKNNIDADFNGSTIYANVTNKKSSTVFSRGLEYGSNHLDYVHISNLLINGGIDVAEFKHKFPENRPSPCIELFFVKDVILDNVDIKQYNSGTEDLKYLTPNYRDTYENYLVALMYGVTAKVTNCDLSHCVNEGFKFAPAIDSTNFIEFSNNSSRNRYWTFLEVDDGRCLVKDNVIDGASSSAFNLFCYDSEVCNNIFRNSIRGCAIDLSEPADGGGTYRSYNVSIHDNKCYNYPQFLEMWAGSVDVYDNYIDGIIIEKASSAGCIVRMLNKYTESSERSFKAPFNNPGGQDEYTKDVQIHDNVFDGEFKTGIIIGNRLSERDEGENVEIVNNLFLDTKSKNPNYYPAIFFRVKNIRFEDNTIGVLKTGTYNSVVDNVYFYCDKCKGILNASNNKVTKTYEKGERYVFSISDSMFDSAIIMDGSKYGFLLLYKPSSQRDEKGVGIITNCAPFPGIKFGRDVKFVN